MAILLYKGDGLKRTIAERIIKDLTVRAANGYSNSQIVRTFYEDRDDVVAVPYYWGLKLLWELSTEEERKKLNINPIVEPITNEFLGELFKNQRPIVEEGLNHLHRHRSVLYNLTTSYGKTIISIYTALQLRTVTLILFDLGMLIPQWVSAVLEFSDAEVWVVDNKSQPPPNVTFLVCMVGRYQHIPDNLRRRIGCVILDEIHRLCTNEAIPAILSCTPRYIIGCSATMSCANKMDQMIPLLCGPERIVRQSTRKFLVYRVKTGIEIPKIKQRNGKLDYTAYLRELGRNEERNKIIEQMLMTNQTKKTLILGSLDVGHVTPMYERLKAKGLNIAIMSGNRESYKDSPFLIGTFQKIGTGFDERAFCQNFRGTRFERLYMLNSFKEDGPLEQAKGRIFRCDENVIPEVIIIEDEHPISKKHVALNCKYFRSINGEIIDIDLTTTSGEAKPNESGNNKKVE